MSNDTHYLEAEINSLFQSDNNMWNFVQRASLDGIWYWDLERSHDLRSPLVSSIGLLSYIDQEIPKDNKRLNKSVSIVKKSLTGLETLRLNIKI